MLRKSIYYFLALASVVAAQAQSSSLNCVVSAVQPAIRSEGVTERAGDIVLNCTGGTPGNVITTNLTIFSLTTVLTNRLGILSRNADILVLLENGGTQQLLNTTAEVQSPSSIAISGITFTVPANGAVNLRISNLRVNAWLAGEQPVRVTLGSNGTSALRIESTPLIVGFPQRALLASYSSTFICSASPVPSPISFSALIAARSRFASVRVTEGQANSFEKRGANSDSGTRVVLRYSGFPQGAQLFVPDAIAGSTATTPTAGGDLGLPTNGGAYTATAQGQLLLVRVKGHDETGAAGSLALTAPPIGSPTVTFNAVSEVLLNSGSGLVVYEVVDSNASARESAQVPVFLGWAGRQDGVTAQGSVAIGLGPISLDPQASVSGAIPRFQSVSPNSDCPILGDCNSGIFPILSVSSDPLSVSGFTFSAPQTRYIRVNNEGGSLLNWTASISYKSGSGWLRIDPAAGLNNGTIRVDFSPGILPAGTYDATLLIDAGPIAGTRNLSLRMEVVQLMPPTPAPPLISSVVNAASFLEGSLVQGSIVTLFGQRFSGTTVGVNFDTTAARVFFSNETQINLVVPDLPGKASAQVVVTVDGRASTGKVINFSSSAPGIFGTLNQDYTLNGAANPALTGSVVQVYVTGLPATGVTAKIADRIIAMPEYAGAAPGFAGLQQVNLRVPADLGTMTTDVMVCGSGVCSPAGKLSIRSAQ